MHEEPVNIVYGLQQPYFMNQGKLTLAALVKSQCSASIVEVDCSESPISSNRWVESA